MWRMLILAGLSGVACIDDGDVLYARVAATQPDDPAFGRLLSVFAAIGDRDKAGSLEIRVSEGMLRSASNPVAVDVLCLDVGASDLVEAQIAVAPTSDESLVLASLREAGDACAGAVRAQIIVPVQRVGGTTSPAVATAAGAL